MTLLICGCGGGSGAPTDSPLNEDPAPSTPDAMPVPLPPEPDDGCPTVFAQNVLATYHLTLAPEEWTKLEDEFLHRAEREAAGLALTPYHPVELRWQDGPPVSALIRLKGNTSWIYTIERDANPKMQFVLAFNEVDPEGRFMGQRKIELDMPRNDKSFLRQRLALFYLRAAGIPAQCAASARVEINGAYYGLYTALERMDKEFLQRVFGDDDEGTLFDGGVAAKTNETTYDHARLHLFWDATTAAELEQVSELEGVVEEWAAEAMIVQADGYYAGRANFYVYDHPREGFLWIPHDLDATVDYLLAPTAWPIFPSRAVAARQHHALVLGDPTWLERYVAALMEVRGSYDVAKLQASVDAWSAQIAGAVAQDPHKAFSVAEHQVAVIHLRSAIRERAEYVDGWLACRSQGGTDADGDGAPFCRDCDDADPAAHPGAVELCNGLDDDCDGRIDDGVTCP